MLDIGQDVRLRCVCLGDLARLRERSTIFIDRSAAAQALAKAIAYKLCGKDRDAAAWARKLVEILECAEILKVEG